ncbi:hypothetical protein EVAR_39921_1 [Eumeta japonica]|uniref:Uncharacterized protein n=1 Tax=Eumeta variegata TaxID=151549 RepID=A0A4C1WPL4_EUMVA|nr:hypothetical protein EVAR_39921_1 [Eumeta japonica]
MFSVQKYILLWEDSIRIAFEIETATDIECGTGIVVKRPQSGLQLIALLVDIEDEGIRFTYARVGPRAGYIDSKLSSTSLSDYGAIRSCVSDLSIDMEPFVHLWHEDCLIPQVNECIFPGGHNEVHLPFVAASHIICHRQILFCRSSFLSSPKHNGVVFCATRELVVPQRALHEQHSRNSTQYSILRRTLHSQTHTAFSDGHCIPSAESTGDSQCTPPMYWCFECVKRKFCMCYD